MPRSKQEQHTYAKPCITRGCVALNSGWWVRRYRESYRGPLLVAVQAAGGYQRLQHAVPLLADLPCVDVPAVAEDSVLPPLGWQQRAARAAVARLAAAGPWLRVLASTWPTACAFRSVRSRRCSSFVYL